MEPALSIKFRKTSVAITVIVSIVTVTTLLLCGLGAVIYKISHDRWWKKLNAEQTILADQLAESLSLPVWNFDDSQIGKIMESAMKNNNIFGIFVKTVGKQARMYARMRDAQWRIISADLKFPTKGFLVEERDIRFSNEQIGKVQVVTTPKFIEALLSQTRVLLVFIMLPFELILALSLYLLLRHMVLKPLQEVEVYAVAVSSGNVVGINTQAIHFQGEVESLRSSIEKMVALLAARYQELHEEMKRRRESEERFQTIFNSVNDAILIHDLDTGSILDVNQKMLEMYGYTREEVWDIDIGTLSSGEPPYTKKDALEWIGKAAKGEPQLFEWHCKDKTERLFWVEVNMRRASIGGIDRLLVVVRDITDRKASEDARRESERHYKFLFESARDAIFLIRDGLFVDCNPKTLEMFGCSRDQIIGETPYRFSPPFQADGRNSKEKALELIASVLDGTPQVFEWKHTKADGTPFDAEVSLNRVELSSGMHIQAIIRDITERKRAEEALKNSEEKFSKFFMAAPAAISVSSLHEGRILDANQEYERILGYRRDELIGRTSLELGFWLDPKDRERIVQLLNAEGKVKDMELHVRTKSGNVRTLRYYGESITLGEKAYLLSTFVDITERKRAEEALRESEERFRGLIEKAPVAISISREGRTIYVNRKYLTLYGFQSVDELVGQPIFDQWAAASREIVRERSQKRARGEPVPSEYEGTGQRKDGSQFPVHIVVETVELPDGPAFMAFFSDITERKQAEEALRESEKRFRQLFEGAADALFVYDLQGRFVDVNEVACNSLGYTRGELLQLFVSDVEVELHPADLPPHRERVLLGQSTIVEGVHRRRDSSTFPVEVHVALFRATERPLFFAAVRDITERKRAEEELTQYRVHLEELVEARTGELSAANKKLKELDRLKSMFIASMSHELRTPLNSIIGFTGMTLQGMSGELNDEQKDNLTRAYFSAKHLLSLITDVIDISKIEAGKMEAYPEGFVLREMVNDAIATIEPQLKDKGLTIKVDVPPETTLTTDRKRLLQCLINFLGNAVKFTEFGGVTIASRRADGQVFLSVSDTGIGIAKKDMHRLFEPFERLETHLRVKAGGTGLGLYLTKKLAIDVLRGDVFVESIEGQGSTFTVRIPEDIRQAQKASIDQNGGDIL